MRILLIILTVMGILLLVLLVLAAVCLFYPVSYRIKGEAEEELSLCGRFWWLLGLFRFEFAIRDFKPSMQFGILWLKWSFGGEEAEEEPHKEKTPKEPGPDAPAYKERAGVPGKKSGQSAETDGSERKTSQSTGTAVSGKKADASFSAEQPGAEEEAALAERHSAEKDKADKKGKRRKKRRKAFGVKGNSQKAAFKERYDRFRTELSDEKNHLAVKHFWQEATYIFTHLRPKYANGAVYFATGDPALTGQVTGALSLLPVMYQYDACVCPDFVSDNPYIRGTIAFGGRMSLYRAVLCLIRIIRDENAMRLIQKFR